jgi:hypothetical protein
MPNQSTTSNEVYESHNEQQRAMECIHIKHVHFEPKFEAAEEERSHRRLARQKEKKVGRYCHLLMAGSSSVVAGAAAARCRPGFEKGVSLRDIVRELIKSRHRESHLFLSAQERLRMAQQQEEDGKSLSVCFPWHDSLFFVPND